MLAAAASQVPQLRAQDMPVRFPTNDVMFISHQGFHLTGNQCIKLARVVEQLFKDRVDFAIHPYDVLCSVYNFVVKYAQQKHLLLLQQRQQQAEQDKNRPRVRLDDDGRLWPSFEPTPTNLATYMSESQLHAFAIPYRSVPLFAPPPEPSATADGDAGSQQQDLLFSPRQRVEFELQMRLLKRVAELSQELEVKQLLAAKLPQPQEAKPEQEPSGAVVSASSQSLQAVANSSLGSTPQLLHPAVRTLLRNLFFGKEQRRLLATQRQALAGVKLESGGQDQQLSSALLASSRIPEPDVEDLREAATIVDAQQSSAYFARHLATPPAAVLTHPHIYSAFSLLGQSSAAQAARAQPQDVSQPELSLYSRQLMTAQAVQGPSTRLLQQSPVAGGEVRLQRRDILNRKLLQVSEARLEAQLEIPALPRVIQALQATAPLAARAESAPPSEAAATAVKQEPGSPPTQQQQQQSPPPPQLTRFDTDPELRRLRLQWQQYTARKRAWQEDCLMDNQMRSCAPNSRVDRVSGLRLSVQSGRQEEHEAASKRLAFHTPAPGAFPADVAVQEHQKMLLRQRYFRLVRLQQAREWFMQQNQPVPYYIEKELRMLPLLELQQRVKTSIVSHIDVEDVLHGQFRSRLQIAQDRRHAIESERRHRQAQQRARIEVQKGILRRMREVHRSFVQFHKFRRQELKRLAQLPVRLLEERQAQLLEDTKRLEKARLKALKADDEDEYYRLVEQTKNDRLKALIHQTDTFMSQLGAKISDERRREELATGTGPILPVDISQNPGAAGDGQKGNLASLVGHRERFYGLAHQIQEKIAHQPSALTAGKLRSYQMQGLEWLVSLYNNRLNGILADEMGLGKTIQTIALIAHLMEHKDEKGPFLVIAPMSTLHNNWAYEFNRWLPDCRAVVYDGQKLQRKQLRETVIKVGQFNVMLTTFDFAMIDKHFLRKIPWRYIIVDEAHRLKNPTCRLGQALAMYNPHSRRVALTGTPLQNDLPELWSLLNFLHPQVFNSCENFERWFSSPLDNLELRSTGGSLESRLNAGAVTAAARAQVAGQEAATELTAEEKLLVVRRLHSMLRPFMLRREKKDVETQLAAKLEKILRCELTPVQLAMYQALWLGDIGMHNRMMQLRKVCNHPYLFHPYIRGIPGARDYLAQPYSPGQITWRNQAGQQPPPGVTAYRIPLNMVRPVGWATSESESLQEHLTEDQKLELWQHYYHPVEQEEPMIQVCGKLVLLDNILPKLRITGHRVLLFCQMTRCMDVLARYFEYRGYPYLRLDGNTGAAEREASLQSYNAPDSPYFMFMLSTKAGGLGLNLQSADTVILYDSDWNPQNDLQAQARAHRIGQKNRVLVLRLLTSDTVEERVMRTSQNKLDAEKVVVRSGMFDRAEQDSQSRSKSRKMLEGVFLKDRGLEARDAAWLGGAAYKRYGRAYSRVMRELTQVAEHQTSLGNPFLRAADPQTEALGNGGATKASKVGRGGCKLPAGGKRAGKRKPSVVWADVDDDEEEDEEEEEDNEEEEEGENGSSAASPGAIGSGKRKTVEGEETGDEVQNDDEISVALARTPEELELFRKMDRLRQEQLEVEAERRDRRAFMAPRWLNDWFLLGAQSRSDDGELVPLYVPSAAEREAKQYLFRPAHLVAPDQRLADVLAPIPVAPVATSSNSSRRASQSRGMRVSSTAMMVDEDDEEEELEKLDTVALSAAVDDSGDPLDFGDRWTDDEDEVGGQDSVLALPAAGSKRSHAQLQQLEASSDSPPAAVATPATPVAAPAASATGLTLTFNFRRKPAADSAQDSKRPKLA